MIYMRNYSGVVELTREYIILHNLNAEEREFAPCRLNLTDEETMFREAA